MTCAGDALFSQNFTRASAFDDAAFVFAVAVDIVAAGSFEVLDGQGCWCRLLVLLMLLLSSASLADAGVVCCYRLLFLAGSVVIVVRYC